MSSCEAGTAEPHVPPVSVTQHRSVGLLQHVTSHLRHSVGSHADDVGVADGMVDLAHRHPVRDPVTPPSAYDDVRGNEQLSQCRSRQRVHRWRTRRGPTPGIVPDRSVVSRRQIVRRVASSYVEALTVPIAPTSMVTNRTPNVSDSGWSSIMVATDGMYRPSATPARYNSGRALSRTCRSHGF